MFQNNAQAQQFAALQKATATYQNDAAAADRLRRRETDLAARAQEAQSRLEEELRAAHGAVGEEERRRTNLEAERKRLEAAAEADKKANVTITSELQGIEADSKEQKKQFVKEIDALNEESNHLLARGEDAKAARLLEAADVTWLVESKVESFATRGDGGDGANPTEEDGKWHDIATKVKEELAGMVEADRKSGEEEKECRELEGMLQQLRAKFLSENGNLGQMELDQLEAKWEEGGGNAMEEVDGANHASASSGVGGSTHMQLFYHEQEYDGPVHDEATGRLIGQAC